MDWHIVCAVGMVTSSLWLVAMVNHGAMHRHFIYRHLLFAFFVMVAVPPSDSAKVLSRRCGLRGAGIESLLTGPPSCRALPAEQTDRKPAMKFGIFYELQLPRPWGVDDERQLYQNALTQVELADKLCYDYAWEVEHHFLEEYSHSPAPEVFLGAASQRTKTIRLGHGIVQLTTNPPQRIAERIACLDLDSNGRVEIGTGESGSVTELGGFGREMETKLLEVWEDAIRCIIPMFQDKGVEIDTKWHKMPLRNGIAETGAETTPSVMGRMLAARDSGNGGPPRHGRSGVPVPLGRRGVRVGARLL